MTFTRYYREVEAMGTGFEAFLAGDDEEHLEAVAVAALEEITRLEGVLSRFDPRSEIARINREAASKPVLVDREIFALLEQCEQARQFTEGFFDITASANIERSCQPLALQLDASCNSVQFSGPGISIDLGGIGKGYALDCARKILLRFGVTRALLQGGTSSVLALDTITEGEGWLIDIRHPFSPSVMPIEKIALKNRGFSCSASRHAEWNTQTQSDVIIPQTGHPMTESAACVVLAANATEGEIYSTALLAMGRKRAMRYLQEKSLALDVGWIDSSATFCWLQKS